MRKRKPIEVICPNCSNTFDLLGSRIEVLENFAFEIELDPWFEVVCPKCDKILDVNYSVAVGKVIVQPDFEESE